ncbi:MAG: VOC family protein [Balneolaceae bacterium]|nr:VOC family protein [Balneolaceae bacterium]
MSKHKTIDYLELPASDIPTTKRFFKEVFDWTFTDYGTEYTSFESEGMTGGFYQSDLHSSTENGAALIIFYSSDLEATQKQVKEAGGTIVKPVFSFPGGRRFHFTEPSGNEFAVWSDK